MHPLTIIETTIRQDAEGRYSLNDLHKAAGGKQRHQPRYFLANSQAKELIAELASEGDSGNPLSVHRGGQRQGTFVCKELVYAYAMWISPAFMLKVIRAYDAAQTSIESAWEQMRLLEKEDAASFARASIGGRFMAERRHALPAINCRRDKLNRLLQPSLKFH